MPDVSHSTLYRFSQAQFERAVGAGVFGLDRVELRDGMVRNLGAESGATARIRTILRNGLQQALARVASPLTLGERMLVRAQDWSPMPDLLLWSCASLEAPVAADSIWLVVHIAPDDPAEDMTERRPRYANCKTPELWVVDGAARVIRQYAQPRNGAFELDGAVGFGKAARALTLPDVSVTLTDLAKL